MSLSSTCDKMETDNNIVEEIKQLSGEHPEFDKKCAKLAEDVKSGNLTFVTLVEHLGPLLVDTSASSRELGTWVLTGVLDRLPPNLLDEKQLQFICAFYTDRFKDQHQVVPAVLEGVLALSQFQHFPEGAAAKILRALFEHVACQQQRELERLNIYKIFEVLLQKCGPELVKMEYDFVYGVIAAVDGERNPKNLVFLFRWFPQFLTKVTLGHLTEEAFEVIACYFPVDFKAPTEDPNAITREQLATLLAPCLTAIPQFADFCLPLALEKLDSSLEIAKIDSLKLLELGCSSFETAAYTQHATSIWSQIQKEVFNNPSPAVETAALTTLTAIIKKLSDEPNLKTILKDLCDTLKGNLIPDYKLFAPSSKVLLSVAAASPAASEQITKEIVPILINTFNITTTAAHKGTILKVLVGFFVSHVGHDDPEMMKIPVLCLKASRDDSSHLRCVGFDGLRHICQFLPKDVRFSLYESLGILILNPQNDEVKTAMLGCFEAVARSFPGEVKEHLSFDSKITNDSSLRSYFDALTTIASQEYFTETVIDTILKYLSSDLDLSQVAVQALKRITDNVKIRQKLLEKNIIKILVDWSQCHEDSLDVQCLLDVAFVVKTTIGEETSEHQRKILQGFSIELTNPRRVFIIDGLLSRLRPDVDTDYKILNDLTHLVGVTTGTVKTTAVQLLANILNKCVETTLLAYLSQFGQTVDLELLPWIVKALVMRNHVAANDWTEKLLELLENDINAAVGFRIVINDNFDCLSPRSHSIRTVLYQQKFFTVVSNKLCEKYQPTKKSYLLALGYLLESAPKRVVLLQFKKILKLVILCLDECGEPEILLVILEIIKDFIVNQEKCIEEQMSDFLARFLKLATFEKSLKVRILAVQCLGACTQSFPMYKLLMHKPEVLAVLGKVIDDKKRIVRREAMETRSVWFLLDAPI